MWGNRGNRGNRVTSKGEFCCLPREKNVHPDEADLTF